MVSPCRGLGKQSRRIPSDGGQGLYAPFFNTLGCREGLHGVLGEQRWMLLSPMSFPFDKGLLTE
jgi:hypothetical protein